MIAVRIAKAIERLDRSSQRMMDALEVENQDKTWWAFMKKEIRLHLKYSVKLWWHSVLRKERR